MSHEEIIVWRDIRTNKPILSNEKLNPLKSNTKNIYIELSLTSEDLELLREIFGSFFSKKYLANEKVLFITVHKKQDIQTFLKAYEIDNKNFFYYLIGILNIELSELKQFMETNDEVIKEMRYYEIHESPLTKAIEEFAKNYLATQSTTNDGEIKSISFQFSHIVKAFKVENQMVLTSIMNCLLLHYNFTQSADFNLLSMFKKSVIKNLFVFFSQQNSYYSAKDDTNAYRIISEILSLADEEYNPDAIKKMLQRMSQ